MSVAQPSSERRDERHDGEAQDRGDGGGQGQQPQGRTLAEWVSLAISTLIVLGLVGTLTYLHFLADAQEKPAVQVTTKLDQVRQEGGFYYVPVEIENQGTETAEEARIRFSLLDQQGRAESTEVVVDFLAGKAVHKASVAFTTDPSRGQLKISSISYREP